MNPYINIHVVTMLGEYEISKIHIVVDAKQFSTAAYGESDITFIIDLPDHASVQPQHINSKDSVTITGRVHMVPISGALLEKGK